MGRDNHFMDENSLTEQIEENLTRFAISEYATLHGKNLLEENNAVVDKDFLPSETSRLKFEQKVNKKLLQKRVLNAKSVIYKYVHKIAVVFLCLIVSCSVIVFTVEAARERFLRLLFSITPEYTQISPVEGSKNDLIVGKTQIYMPTLIPDNYYLRSIDNKLLIKTIEYGKVNNDELTIIFRQMTDGSVLNVDTENADYSQTVTIYEHDGLAIKKNGQFQLVWSDEHNFYMLTADGSLSLDELMAMAKSVELVGEK